MPSPTYPTPLDQDVASWVTSLDDNQREFFEERAGIAEFDAGLARIEAERLAMLLTVRHFGLTYPVFQQNDRQ